MLFANKHLRDRKSILSCSVIVRELGSRLVASTSLTEQETSLVTKQREADCDQQVVLVVKNPSADAGGVRDGGQRCRLEMSGRETPWRVNGNPLYSCLEVSWTEEADRLQFIGAKSWTRLDDLAHPCEQPT